MKYPLFCLIAANLLAGSLAAQEKIGVYIQAGPWLNMNNYTTSGIGKTHMPATQLAMGAGLEIDIPVSGKFAIVPFVKYYGQQQLVEQNESAGMFSDDAYFRVFNGYATLNAGAFAQYSLLQRRKMDWQVLAGLSYAHSSAASNGSSYRFTSNMDGPYSIILGSDDQLNDFDRKARFLSLSAGSRLATHIRKQGDFKFGFVLFAPMGYMPRVSYTSEFMSNNQYLYTKTYTRNRQFSLECSIMYRLFGWRV